MMKKTSTRLATIGVLILLGACAIALAQHDSRKRERTAIRPEPSVSESVKPIPVDGDWSDSFETQSSPIVRANNDRLTSYGGMPDVDSDNPLRNATSSADSGSLSMEGNTADVQLPGLPAGMDTKFANYDTATDTAENHLVSGEIPDQPPSWLGGAGAQSKLPKLPSTTREATPPPGTSGRTNATLSNLPSNGLGTPLPALPLPTQSTAPSGSPRASTDGMASIGLPTETTGPGLLVPKHPLAAGTPSPNVRGTDAVGQRLPHDPNLGHAYAGQPSNAVSDLSDTQRGALPATDLSKPLEYTAGNSHGTAGHAASPLAGVPSLPAGTEPRNTEPRNNVLSNPGGTSPHSPPSASFSSTSFPSGGGLPPNPHLPNSSQAGANTSGIPSPSNDTAGTYPGFPGGATGGLLGSAPATANGTTGRPRSSDGRTIASLAGLVSNKPGERYLDGSQNPILLIQKRAPEEIQVGKNATFVITVRNAGNATAHGVTVMDRIPRGARLAGAVPAVTPTADGLLAWNLGEIPADDERTITLQIVPEVQGEVGSVATVHFAAQASVRTVATMPKLELMVESQPDVLIGNVQQISVTIRNAGSGVASGVRLEADIPQELKHESGVSQLEAVLGDVRPSETKRITLAVSAVQPGQSQCVVRAVSVDGVQAEKQFAIDVRAPALAAAIEGPKLRYLERQATYRIAVKNTGTAAATDLDFVVHLPSGLKFNTANNGGSYDPASHSVSWGLYELPSGQVAPMELTVLPVELGVQVLTLAASGDLGIAAEAKRQVTVDGLAELAFTIGQDNGTIEVGASSTYSVQITNVGNKPERDVRLAVELPPGTEILAVDAPVEYRAEGRLIQFAPVAEMRNKDQYTYRFQVRHNQAGTQIVRAKLASSNWPEAVVKEEGTLVYNDQN